MNDYPFSDLILRIAETQFWPYVEKTEGCWLWRGKRMRNGYGCIYVKKHIVPAAHRFAFELLRGVIPSGLDLDHLCRVRHCVNPAHLEPVTRSENLRRGDTFRAVLASGDKCRHGHSLDDGNGYIYIGKRGRRYTKCRECDKQRYHGTCDGCGTFYKDLYSHKKYGNCVNATSNIS